MYTLIPYFGLDGVRAMIFVDGENLAIRFGAFLRDRGLCPRPEVAYVPDVYVWHPLLGDRGVIAGGALLRTHYYTVVQGDHPAVDQVADSLKTAGIGAPRVFKKARGGRSKRVDISLATDMLTHAFRRNYDIAVLVAGDEDYVPLVGAVQAEGRGVHVWFLGDAVSPSLVRAADRYVDIGDLLAEACPQAGQ